MISNPYAKKHANGNSAAPQRQRPQPPAAHPPPPHRANNPYAASSTAAATATTNHSSSSRSARPAAATAAAAAAAAASIPHIPVPRAATFSQAFDSFDTAGDDQQQQQQQEPPSPAAPNPQQQQQPPVMSERDHHVLLQQPHVLYVSTKQRGNGVLDRIRNVPMQYSPMVPDFIFSSTACALFLSLRYHNLFSDYVHRRAAALRSDFALRVLLVLVDVDDSAGPLRELHRAAVAHNLTLILAWSEAEAARYLETYKALDGRDASSIQKSKDRTSNLADQVTDFVTACRTVNRTDAGQILSEFGSVRAAVAAAPDELGLIGGLGPVKVQRLWEAWHKPFSSKAARERRKRKQEQAEREQQQAEKEAAGAAKLANRKENDDNNDEDGAEEGGFEGGVLES